MFIFRKVCNFNLFKTNSPTFQGNFPQILYLTGNFINQLSAKFLLKNLREIVKLEINRKHFDNFRFSSIQTYQNIRRSHREEVCRKRTSIEADYLQNIRSSHREEVCRKRTSTEVDYLQSEAAIVRKFAEKGPLQK